MSDLSKVMVVVLAGGMGTRLRKVVIDRPKVIAEINGRPFLYYILDQMIEVGINKAIISTGYMADTVEETVGVLYKSLHVDYSKEKTPLGTGGALKLAGQTIDTEYCLVINGDSYTEFDLISLFMAHKQKNANITILVKAVDDSTRFGTIQMNKQNEIIKFMEKGSGKRPGLINAGVYMVNTSIIQKISKKVPCSLEYDFFPKMVGRGICGYETKGKFIDIGTPESYSEAEIIFRQLSAQA